MSTLGAALIAQLDAGDLQLLAGMVAEHLAPVEASSSLQPDRWLTTAEAASRAHCCPETLRRAIRAQGLSASRVGSTWRISPESLDAWLRWQPEQGPTAPRPRPRTRKAHVSVVGAAFAALDSVASRG